MTDDEKKESSENLPSKESKLEQPDSSKTKFEWQFCPRCGGQILSLKSPKYCTYCGLDLLYLKEHKTLPPAQPPTLKTELLQKAPPNTSLNPLQPMLNPSDNTSPLLKEQTPHQELEIEWTHCPRCGYKLLKLKKQRYCLNCGLDFLYVKNSKSLPQIQSPPQQAWYPPSQQYLPPQQSLTPQQSLSPQQSLPPQQYPPPQQQLPPQQYPGYIPPEYSRYSKIPDQEILNTKGRKLWGTLPSLGIPLLEFVLMNAIILALFIAIIMFTANESLVMSFLTNPYFIVLSTLVEFVLILFPYIYAGKYLEHPTLNNRFTLLGFTSKQYSRKSVTKEVFIGLLFACVGLLLVVFTTIIAEILIENLFGIDIIQVTDESSSDVDYLLSAGDVIVLILLIAAMIFCVGPAEEILFRGFMAKGLIRTLGKKEGTFITALIFALIHLVIYMLYIIIALMIGDGGLLFENGIMFLLAFPPYLAVSLMLGLLYNWREENLIACIIAHGVYNSLTLLIAYLFIFFY